LRRQFDSSAQSNPLVLVAHWESKKLAFRPLLYHHSVRALRMWRYKMRHILYTHYERIPHLLRQQRLWNLRGRLIDSGLPYTIVHPGGLINEPGNERELVLGIDDSQDGTESRSVPREDVAEVMMQSLLHSETYKNRSFDLRSKPVGEGDVTKNFVALEKKWLDGKNCNYSLGKIADE